MTCEINAVQHVRKMRGGSQSHLLRASDGAYYVTKFQGNPQHTRVLANEMLATNVGLSLGLPMAQTKVVQVDEWLIEHTPDLRFELTPRHVKCPAGRHLGSRFAIDPLIGQYFDYLPDSMTMRVVNVGDFARVLVLDKWLGNADGRQVVFSKTVHDRRYTATFIDQGYCFNAAEWTFPDSALRGVYARNEVYAGVTGWASFEPALTLAEEFDMAELWRHANAVPGEWYEHRRDELDKLVEATHERRKRIRDLISAFRLSTRQPFPNWV